MSLVVKVNATAIDDAIPPSSVGSQMRAYDGDVGFAGFAIDDPGATITTTGHHVVTVEESSCAQPRLFTGYLTDRDIARSLERGMIAGDDARAHQATAVDVNACFNFRVIRGSQAKRPEESMEDRLTWLLGSSFLGPFIDDTGYASMYPGLTMDAADYTGGTPASVMQDLVERKSDTPMTYFAFWDPVAETVGLFFGSEADGIGESSLSISNVIADVNGTTIFAPDAEAKLNRTPEEVYSEVVVEYANGEKRLYRRREATATMFGIDRGTTIQRPYTQSATTAQNQADRWLTKHGAERDEITVTIIVPPASAGLALAGQRIDCKFTHLPGYEAWTSMRIVTSTITPWDDTATQYRVELVLRMPVATSAWPPAGPCEAETPTASQYFPPNNNDGISTATGELTYHTGGTAGPTVATPNYDGNLTFPEWGAGGSPDYGEAPYWGNNKVRVHVVGPGTLEIDTAQADRGSGISNDNTFKVQIGIAGTQDVESTPVTATTFGESVTVTVPDDDHCAHWVQINGDVLTGVNSNCGFAGATWTAADDAPDEEEDLGSTPTSPIISTTDPTANDDANDGYTVGQLWVNTTTGAVFVLTDSTVGAAVWTPMGTLDLDDLADVNAPAPNNGDVLTWDSTPGEWVAAPVPTASPATTVEAETSWGISPSVGTDTEYARQDHTHGTPAEPATSAGGIGPILVEDTPAGSPLVFADLLQNEEGTDLLYADAV